MNLPMYKNIGNRIGLELRQKYLQECTKALNSYNSNIISIQTFSQEASSSKQQNENTKSHTENVNLFGKWKEKIIGGYDTMKDKYKNMKNGERKENDFQVKALELLNEVKEAIMPLQENKSATKVRVNVKPLSEINNTKAKGLILKEKKKTTFEKIFDRFQKQAEKNPFFSKIIHWKTRGSEIAGDLKERMDNSDSPWIMKIQDYQDRLFSESEAAQVMRQIKDRDPNFDLVNFLLSVKEDVPIVIKAYLEGKEDILKQHCKEEMTEKLIGMYKHYEMQGSFQDPTLLFVSDVELFDATFVEEQPVIVVTFTCQQINCMRDKFGNVVEGKEDEIQQVYYAWALQQDEQGALDEDGNILPPRWQLREMMIRAFHALL